MVHLCSQSSSWIAKNIELGVKNGSRWTSGVIPIADTSGGTSWKALNDWEQCTLLTEILAQVRPRENLVVLGNFGNGPAVHNVCPQVREMFPLNYEFIDQVGMCVIALSGANPGF